MEQIQSFLKKLPLFSSYSSEDLENLIEKSRVKTYSPSEIIIKFGEPGSFLGVVLSGKAEAVITGRSGERQQLGLIRQGDIIGEMSLLTGEPTTADVIPLETCELLLIPQEIFSTFLAINPVAIQVMARIMRERLKSRQQNEEAQALVSKAWQSTPDPYGLSLSSTIPLKILVINCGSSSLKFSYFDTDQEVNNIDGVVEKIGLNNARIVLSSKKRRFVQELDSIDHSKAFEAVIESITNKKTGVVKDLSEITAVGHRVVHGGDKYGIACLINDEVIQDIENYADLAPLHNPLNLMAINKAIEFMPGVPQIAVFDTAFHQKMPQHAYLYGLPYDFYHRDRVRRYGFHGISHNYVSLRAAAYLKRDFQEMKIITCHLGNGSSVCAINHGRSIDTSMGMTPLEGLIMGTRSGDIDPAIIFRLCKERGLSIDEVDRILNNESGLKGLSGISSDLRELEEAANKGNTRAILAINTYSYRIKKYIGAYIAAMGGVDVLVFTGGIGEGSSWVRSLSCQGLSYMGIEIDDIINRTVRGDSKEVVDITGTDSKVSILIVPTDEEKMIAREVIHVLGNQTTAQIIQNQKDKAIPIEVSAHHVHLSSKEVEALFGLGYKLTRRSDLSQPGQFACEETVDLVGPRGKVEKVRVLGPERNQCQVEVSLTEEYRLGIKAPIRPSGDLEGSPGIVLEGPYGSCEISEGVICALRHIHMAPEDALGYGLRDKDIVSITVRGDRTLTFGDVLVRVDNNYKLDMHIDTDEANAANITTGMEGYLTSIQDRR
jgi:acetate kinase